MDHLAIFQRNGRYKMPYKSNAQRGKFHILEKEGKISPKVVKEFDKASKGKKLPERIRKKK